MVLYDFAQICLNGHVINAATETYPHLNRKFCDECGAPSITNCPNCKAKIEGQFDPKGEWESQPYIVPAYCSECGNPFPWTESKIQAAHELAQELENISEDEKIILSKSIDDLVRDTTNTELAATRFKRIISKAGKTGINAFKNILLDIATEKAKELLGLW